MFEHTAFARVRNVDEPDSSTPSLPGSRPTRGVNRCEFDELLALAREAGMLVTLDGQIGRETYQSVTGSLASFERFAQALRMICVARLTS